MLLNEMLTELRAEARISADISHGAHLTPRYIALLRRTQEEVYAAYDWPNLNVTQTVSLAANQRYAALPNQISAEGVRRVFALSSDTQNWDLLGYGITAENMNDTDSDAADTGPHVRAWQRYLSPLAEQVSENMFEVWPIPDQATTLRFEGKRALLPLVNPATDRSTIDGVVVCLHAAAELLAANNAQDAGLKIQKAQQRFDQLRKTANAGDNTPLVYGSGRGRATVRGLLFRMPK